jgi:hypothetical protein
MNGRQIVEGNYMQDGILQNRLGRVVDPGLCRECGWEVPPKQEAAYAAYCEEFAAAYHAMRPEPSGEEAFEMRAAFGPGVEVVDVFTGRRHRT